MDDMDAALESCAPFYCYVSVCPWGRWPRVWSLCRPALCRGPSRASPIVVEAGATTVREDRDTPWGLAVLEFTVSPGGGVARGCVHSSAPSLVKSSEQNHRAKSRPPKNPFSRCLRRVVATPFVVTPTAHMMNVMPCPGQEPLYRLTFSSHGSRFDNWYSMAASRRA